jgi:hypothetical protein
MMGRQKNVAEPTKKKHWRCFEVKLNVKATR